MNPREKAKLLLCAIIQAAGGYFNGKTRLYKAFYFAHLFYFRDFKGVLSDHPVVRMPKGPAVDDGTSILAELQSGGNFEHYKPSGWPVLWRMCLYSRRRLAV